MTSAEGRQSSHGRLAGVEVDKLHPDMVKLIDGLT